MSSNRRVEVQEEKEENKRELGEYTVLNFGEMVLRERDKNKRTISAIDVVLYPTGVRAVVMRRLACMRCAAHRVL